jgi:hypothetical protein
VVARGELQTGDADEIAARLAEAALR